MSKIHYFQRYSSPENTVTNNTLQLIAQIYDYSITKLNDFLGELFDEDIGVGIEIDQQRRGKNSIPDGVIQQRSFKILVESKVGADVNVRQLINHCGAFDDQKIKLLVLLTIRPIETTELKAIEAEIDQKDNSIIFKNVTYQDICKSLDGLFKDYEDDITGIIEDYITYCRDTGLIDEADFLMRIVPTGTTFDLNKKYALYFQPSDRGYSKHAYIGFYRRKAVNSMMKVESVFDVQYENGKLTKQLVSGQETTKYDERITAMIKDAREHCHYEIEGDHRFFCGNETFDTCFKKTTPGGIQGARFVNLKNFGVENITDTAIIADALKTQIWK